MGWQRAIKVALNSLMEEVLMSLGELCPDARRLPWALSILFLRERETGG